MSQAPTKFPPRTALAVIIANMVGTGVFTSLGFQLADIKSVFALLMLWVIGGIAALCGSLSYAELGAALPRSGGEYNFLGRIYHPAAGFISGWISATIGFAAPIAAVALAFGKYSAAIIPGGLPPFAQTALACSLVIISMLIHSRNRTLSGGFQLGFTAIKVALIALFCVAAFAFAKDPQPMNLMPQSGDGKLIFSGTYAVALIYVTYAYTGWNAATYISGEMENPQRNLPRVLLFGTALVTVLYVILNAAFLYTAPQAAMANEIEIGYISAQGIFGDIGGRIAGGMMAILLVSTVSAMTLAGPRALQAIGEDFPALGFLGKINKSGMPRNAIWFQSLIALFLIVTMSFKFIVIFAGALLAFNAFLAVLGLFVLRWREPDLERPFKVWGYPLVPLTFLAITGFTLVYVAKEEPGKVMFAVGIIAAGGVFYWLSRGGRAIRHD